MGDFGTRYANIRPTKESGSSPVIRGEINRQQENNTFNWQQENNATVNNAVDGILLTQKVSATNHEALEILDSSYDANYLYEVDKMSLGYTK